MASTGKKRTSKRKSAVSRGKVDTTAPRSASRTTTTPAKSTPRGVTIAAYAKMRGVSEARIRRLVKDGVVRLVGRRIDPVLADQQIAEAADPAFEHLGPLGGPGPGRPASGEANPGTGLAYRTARAYREHFRAKLAKLEYERAAGTMVDANEVRDAIFRVCRMIRDSILAIPSRIAPIIAAESDEFKVRQLLTQELRASLEALANGRLEAEVDRIADDQAKAPKRSRT